MNIAGQGKDTSWIRITEYYPVWADKTKFLERISKMWRECHTEHNTNYLQINTIWAQNLANSTISRRKQFQISMS